MRELTRPCCQKCAQYRLTQSDINSDYSACENTIRLEAEKKRLEAENRELHQKNIELEETVAWMHDLIWDLTRRLHGQTK